MPKDGGGPIARYLQVLEIIAASENGLTLTDISRMTGLPKPTTHRLVRSLVDVGALSANEGWYKSFRIGERMWRMLQLGLHRDRVTGYAQIVLDALAGELGETCYVVRLGAAYIRSIARSVPDQGHYLHVFPGEQLPGHAAASAKAILAFQDEETRRRFIPEPLPPLTSRTQTDMKALLAELATVRENDFAICYREIDENVIAYAVPVHLPSAGVIYAIGVTGPVSRLERLPAESWKEALAGAAERFSAMLGEPPSESE